jgi:hypothetical protein
MDSEKLQQLKGVILAMQNGITKSTFEQSFRALTTLVLNTEKKIVERNQKINEDLMKLFDDLKKQQEETTDSELKASIKKFSILVEKMMKEQADSLNFIRDKVRKIKEGNDGVDGKTPTKEEITSLIIPLIPPVIQPKEETPIETRDKLESIKEEKEKLSISAISELRKELDELKARPIGRGGGGTSAMGVAQAFKYIAHTEEPVGAINGVNLTYTVKNDIFWIAGFVLNGEQIAQLPNFTYSGRTITFASALPSVYSGKDFECKYIG